MLRESAVGRSRNHCAASTVWTGQSSEPTKLTQAPGVEWTGILHSRAKPVRGHTAFASRAPSSANARMPARAHRCLDGAGACWICHYSGQQHTPTADVPFERFSALHCWPQLTALDKRPDHRPLGPIQHVLRRRLRGVPYTRFTQNPRVLAGQECRVSFLVTIA